MRRRVNELVQGGRKGEKGWGCDLLVEDCDLTTRPFAMI